MSEDNLNNNSIYGEYKVVLETIMNRLCAKFEEMNEAVFNETGDHLYEHLTSRIKSDDSMREKCERRGFKPDAYSAVHLLRDAIGIRIITSFREDIYAIIEAIRKFDNCQILEEKDYIKHAKDNGYRSYHMILAYKAEFEDPEGNNPGEFFVEIQLRTIAMDSWASLEHKMRYKKDIKNQKLIEQELKRCADELASCDVSLQTIRRLIKESD